MAVNVKFLLLWILQLFVIGIADEPMDPTWVGNWTELQANFSSKVLGGLNVRVSKGMLSRGYNKIRLSMITTTSVPPSGIAWEYAKRFAWKWTNYYLFSSVQTVTPGQKNTFSISGQNVEVTIPEQGKGTRGILFADPCVSQNDWCIYANPWQIFSRTSQFLNRVMAEEGMDFWYILGDNFYDVDGGWTNKWFNALSQQTKSKVSGMVLGNHDYWIGGSPGAGQSYDQLGIGMNQWYAQDVLAGTMGHNMMDWSQNPNGKERYSTPPVNPQNSIWWNQLGNVGFLGYSGAYSWNTYSSYVDAACTQFSQTDDLAAILVFGHWNGANLGCQSGMEAPSVASKMKGMSSCSKYKNKIYYVDGHQHCNQKQNGGFLIGANGMKDCGQFGHIYFKSFDDGRVQVWYFEFAKSGHDYWNEIWGCVNAHGIDACTSKAQLWLDTGSGPTPPPPDPTPTPKPGTCTQTGGDPWATGKYIDCCSGDKCLKNWSDGQPNHYLCEPCNYSGCYNSGRCPNQDCTKQNEDPYASGQFVPCCSGMDKCLEDWDHNGRWHYLCESCPYSGCTNSRCNGLERNNSRLAKATGVDQ